MAGGGRDSGMKQQDKLGFQNGARNALKMFEIVIDICVCIHIYIRCTISDGHSAALLCATLYGQKPYKLLVSSNYTDLSFGHEKKTIWANCTSSIGIAQA